MMSIPLSRCRLPILGVLSWCYLSGDLSGFPHGCWQSPVTVGSIHLVGFSSIVLACGSNDGFCRPYIQKQQLLLAVHKTCHIQTVRLIITTRAFLFRELLTWIQDSVFSSVRHPISFPSARHSLITSHILSSSSCLKLNKVLDRGRLPIKLRRLYPKLA